MARSLSAPPPKLVRGSLLEINKIFFAAMHDKVCIMELQIPSEKLNNKNKKLIIYQISKFYAPYKGGIETVVQNLSEGLVARSHDVTVVCYGNDRPYVTLINGVRVLRAKYSRIWASQPISLNIFRYIYEAFTSADIINIHSPNPLAEFAVIFIRILGLMRLIKNKPLKVIVSYHCDITRQKILIAPYKWFFKIFLKITDHVVVSSNQLKENSKFLSGAKSKTKVIPFGIPKVLSITETSLAKKALDPYFIFVGRLVHYKGVSVLLDAVRQANVNLKIIGDGPLRSELMSKAKEMKLDHLVEFLGPVEDDAIKNSYISKSLALVLPSIDESEAFGIVLIEALSMGVPIITTRIPTGIDFVNDDGVTGIKVAPSNIGSLASAMLELQGNVSLRSKMSKSALERYALLFDVNRMVESYINNSYSTVNDKKILMNFAIHDLNMYGGQDRSTLEIIRKLSNNFNIKINSYTCQHDDESLDLRKIHPAIKKPVLFKSFYFHIVTMLRYFISRENNLWHATGASSLFFDISHIQYLSCAWREKLEKLKLSYAKDNQLFPVESSIYKRVYRWLNLSYDCLSERLAFKKNRNYIALSRRVKDDLIRIFKIPSNQIVVVPHGVDSNQFRPALPEEKLFARSKRGISKDDFVVLLVGAYDRKGLVVLMKSVAKISNKRIKVLAVGSGDLEYYHKLSNELNISDQLILECHSKNILESYHAADLFVLPSFYEPFGLVCLEAMACGLPSIISSATGASELGTDGREYIVLKNETDVTELSNKLVFMVSDKQLRISMGNNARQLAISRSWDVVASEYKNHLDNIIESRLGRSYL